jgi:hypothetical protein
MSMSFTTIYKFNAVYNLFLVENDSAKTTGSHEALGT